MFGKYDEIRSAATIDNVEFIVFSDRYIDLPQPWKLSILDDLEFESPILKNRYVKMHPHIFLNEFDESIYIDANIAPKHGLLEFLKKCVPYDFCAFKHPYRSSIREEIIALAVGSRIDINRFAVAVSQYRSYLSLGYIDNLLIEANIIYRKHNKYKVIDFMNSWWFEFYNGVHRDQISLCFCLKNAKDLNFEIFESINVRKDNDIVYCYPHNKNNFIDYLNALIRKIKKHIYGEDFWIKKFNQLEKKSKV